jgi:glycosyltransferase involved in cell wall biosynthesis
MELNSLRRDKFTLLVFGHISMRKNIFNIMRALRLLEPNIQDKLQLLIVGEVDLTYQNIFEQLISDFVKDVPNLLILKIEKFVTVSEMNYIFEQSDYLLMPYTNAYKSSGIIGLAAKHEKLIIGPNTGVMHDLIQDYKLGLTVNPYDVNELKSVIELLGNNEERQLKSDFDRYIEERKPTEFSKTIFNVLLSYF